MVLKLENININLKQYSPISTSQMLSEPRIESDFSSKDIDLDSNLDVDDILNEEDDFKVPTKEKIKKKKSNDDNQNSRLSDSSDKALKLSFSLNNIRDQSPDKRIKDEGVKNFFDENKSSNLFDSKNVNKKF